MYKFRYIPLSPMTFHYIGGFLKWGYPKMVFMEKPIKMDDLAVRTPISGNLHIHPYPTTSNHIPIISQSYPYHISIFTVPRTIVDLFIAEPRYRLRTFVFT